LSTPLAAALVKFDGCLLEAAGNSGEFIEVLLLTPESHLTSL